MTVLEKGDSRWVGPKQAKLLDGAVAVCTRGTVRKESMGSRPLVPRPGTKEIDMQKSLRYNRAVPMRQLHIRARILN